MPKGRSIPTNRFHEMLGTVLCRMSTGRSDSSVRNNEVGV